MTSKRWNVCVLVAVMAGFAAGALAQTMDWPWFYGTAHGDPMNEVDVMGNIWEFGVTSGTLNNPPDLAGYIYAAAAWDTVNGANPGAGNPPGLTLPAGYSNEWWNASNRWGNMINVNEHPYTWTWGAEHGFRITIGKAGLYDIRGSLTHSHGYDVQIGAFKIRGGVTNWQRLAYFTPNAGTPTDLDTPAYDVDPVWLEVGDVLVIGSAGSVFGIDWTSTDLVRTDPVATTLDWPWFYGSYHGDPMNEVDAIGNTWEFGVVAGVLDNPPDLAGYIYAAAVWDTVNGADPGAGNPPGLTLPASYSNEWWNTSSRWGNMINVNEHPYTWTWGAGHGFRITAGQPGTYDIRGSLAHSHANTMQVGAFTFEGGVTNWQQLAYFTANAGTPTDLDTLVAEVALNPGDVLVIGSDGSIFGIDWTSTDLVFTPFPPAGTVLVIR